MGLSYDDNAASVFGVTILLFYLIPASWFIIKRIRTFQLKQKLAGEGGEVFADDDEGGAAAITSVAPRSRAEAKKIHLLKASAKRDVLWTTNFKLFILGTVLAALLFLFLIFRSSGQAELAQYDPYQILGLSADATETEINKSYRKLARTYHPDIPVTGDAEMFQKIKKAHDALTDPVVKENYRLYGNPDGRQALEVSIGLPNFLKGGVSGWALLLIYVVGLVVAIPMAACRFYKRNKDKDSSTGLHNGTLFWLSHRLSTFPEGTQVRLMPEIIGGCLEPVLEHPQAKDETTGGNPILHPAIKELLVACRREELFTDITPSDPSKNRNRFLIPREYVTRHALLLLAHCNKQKLAAAGALKGMTKDLLIVQLGLLKSLGKLCDLMVQMGVELEANGERKVAMMVARGEVPPNMRPQPNRYFDAIKNILHFQQLVTQGLWENDKTLRVLFSEAALQSLYSKENKGGHKPTSLGQYLSYPPSERPMPPVLNDAEKAEVESVARDLPLLDISVKAEVEGCEDIREEDIITVTLTLKHKNLVNASLGGYGEGDENTAVPPVYAPSFPYPRKEEWWIFLVDEKSIRGGVKKLVFPAHQKFTPSKAVETVKMQFQAPPLVGTHSYTVYCLSACYLDADRSKEFSVDVLERLKSNIGSEGKKKKRKNRKGKGKNKKDEDDEEEEQDEDNEEEEEEEEEDNDADMALENLLSGGNREAGADYDSDLDAEGGDGDEDDDDEDGSSTSDDEEEEAKGKSKKGSASAAASSSSSSSAPAASPKSSSAKPSASTPAASPKSASASSSKKALTAEEAAAAAAAELLAEEGGSASKGGASGKKGGKGSSAKKGGKAAATGSAAKAASGSSNSSDKGEDDDNDNDDDDDFGAFGGGRSGVTGGNLRKRRA